MAIALLRLRSSDESARRLSQSLADRRWARFGDEVVFDVTGTPMVRAGARRAGGPAPKTVRGAGELYLVTQVGNVFRKLHPRVPVAVDKGRYLLAQLDEAARRRVLATKDACYRIARWNGPVVAFDTVDRARAATAPVARVRDLVARVDRARLAADVRRLAAHRTRLSTGPEFRRAAGWAQEVLEGLGYRVRAEAISVRGKASINVVADRAGDGPSGARGLVVVSAHLDSVNLRGAAERAPGADDNASGVAGALEIARALGGERLRHDLRVVLFGGEEQGLFGSAQHVGALAATERRRIRAVVNMDMIARRNTEARTVMLEGAEVSRDLMGALAAAAATYTDLAVQTSTNPFNSDHVPFIDAGLPAVLTIEGADSANDEVHTAGDTARLLDRELMAAIVRMNVAVVAEAATAPATPPAVEEPADAAPSATALAEMLRRIPFQLSGSYTYGGGAGGRVGSGRTGAASGRSRAELRNPLYALRTPVFLDELSDRAGADPEALRFTLRVDIDGTDPLGVVSGAVARGTAETHFLGRVVTDELQPGGRRVVVEASRFPWPESPHRITQLELLLTGSVLERPTARVTFRDPEQGRDYGPFVASQASIYFREVEVEVDHEVGAATVEPYDTHHHTDRPADLPRETLTLEGEFGKAGIRITRVADSGEPVVASEAEADARWSEGELHDSMVRHWQVFANRPQWKMWILLANRAEDDNLGGVMFDGDIDEPGGVDRQGTAIFTRCPFFHTAQGDYCKANPPAAEAARRELFFNLMHETGHAFNLAHSFQKDAGGPWSPPPWMPLAANAQALSWMNYPDSASPPGAKRFNASWFYRRFRFRFDAAELLFLRHAPEGDVQMGAEAWFEQHGRVARPSVDPRLALTLRSRKPFLEFGEPAMIELKLQNAGGERMVVHDNLDPSEGLVELAITNPRGERRPFVPFDHARRYLVAQVLEPGEAVYAAIDATMGAYGFAFKEPGAYRIEASYTNVDGGTAAAVMRVFVRPPGRFDDVGPISELFDARVGRVLYVEGTRVMDEVNERLSWVSGQLGPDHPISQHLVAVRYLPLERAWKVVESSNRLTVYAAEPDLAARQLSGVVLDRAEAAADTMGHIWFHDVVDRFTEAAVAAGDTQGAAKAQRRMLDLFRARQVKPAVVASVESRLRTLR